MEYIEAASDIFKWLKRYQVNQETIKPDYEGGKVKFVVNHPVQGKVSVNEAIPDKEYFQINGLGMRRAKNEEDKVELECYDNGGIWDPLDGNVPGTHYATTHFALLGAILLRNKKAIDVESVKRAIQFHIRTSGNEYVFDSWMYHWDFQNYAFLETYILLKDLLSEKEIDEMESCLLSSKENIKNTLTNWIAMRAYFAVLKHTEFHNYLDKVRFLMRLQGLNGARLKDGCYDDSKNLSRVIQYHIYTVALLHRIYIKTGLKRVKQNFLQGVNYFCRFIDPDGCFNYLGRGQEQIFGYGTAIYALEAAKVEDSDNAYLYQYYINRLWKYLLHFKKGDHFLLVLNSRNNEEKFGWYDYHHLTVYNAFLGVWLGFTHSLKTKKVEEKKPDHQGVYFAQHSQVAFINNKNVFAAIFGGLPEYLTEAGLTFHHIWFENIGWFFSCPGGPSVKKFGKSVKTDHVEKNVFAPVACESNGNWLVPSGKTGEIGKKSKHTIMVSLNYGPFTVKREVEVLERGFVVTDEFRFNEKKCFNELRFLNLPVVIDKFEIIGNESEKVSFRTKNGSVEFVILESDFNENRFEKLERIKAAKGLAEIVALREKDFQAIPGTKKRFKFKLSAL